MTTTIQTTSLTTVISTVTSTTTISTTTTKPIETPSELVNNNTSIEDGEKPYPSVIDPSTGGTTIINFNPIMTNNIDGVSATSNNQPSFGNVPSDNSKYPNNPDLSSSTELVDSNAMSIYASPSIETQPHSVSMTDYQIIVDKAAKQNDQVITIFQTTS